MLYTEYTATRAIYAAEIATIRQNERGTGALAPYALMLELTHVDDESITSISVPDLETAFAKLLSTTTWSVARIRTLHPGESSARYCGPFTGPEARTIFYIQKEKSE